jgi:transcriptional regulator with XRE-family HTH domain
MAMTIAQRIKAERQIRGMTQTELARHVGVAREAVTQWEGGDARGLRPENLVRTAWLFGVTVEWLVFGTGPKRPNTCSSHGPDNPPLDRVNEEIVNEAMDLKDPSESDPPLDLVNEVVELILLYRQIPAESRAIVNQFFEVLARAC